MRALAPFAVLALAACGAPSPDEETIDPAHGEDAITAHADPRADLAFFSSLPILWGEGDIGDLLSSDQAPHRVRATLEHDYRLVPLDRLTALDDQPMLLMAQPRALAADENVALDNWIRGGGRLLMFVDPMLTEHSEYGLADRRRPEIIAMLSPILARWGLRLEMRGDAGPGSIDWEGTPVPVSASGRFVATGEGYRSKCTLSAEALIARCRIGKGEALIVADAALLEADHEGESHDASAARTKRADRALSALLEEALGDGRGRTREIAGRGAQNRAMAAFFANNRAKMGGSRGPERRG